MVGARAARIDVLAELAEGLENGRLVLYAQDLERDGVTIQNLRDLFARGKVVESESGGFSDGVQVQTPDDDQKNLDPRGRGGPGGSHGSQTARSGHFDPRAGSDNRGGGLVMSPRYRPCLGSSLSLPAQVSLEDKLGGLPWGLPLEKWPFVESAKNR